MIEKMLCQNSGTLLDAMKVINDNQKGAVFIVDEKNRICGIATDGDIRRFILEGHQLQEKIINLISKDYVCAKQGESEKEIFNKFEEKIRIVPIIDKNNEVVDYVEFRKDLHVPIISPDLIGNEFKYLIDAFLSTWISSTGEYITRFEKEFSNYIGSNHGLATANGTTALHLALMACGVAPGDEVIVPDLTFAATVNVVLHCQAKPVIVDIEKDSWGIDPKEIEKAVTSKTKAIIPVHLYGQPCNMNEIMLIAKKHKIFVIEDCAEAHGATYNGNKVGAIGTIGCFSFFGNKIITTGEGGMCVTNDAKIAEKMRVLRDHGMSQTRKYWHDEIGYNYRMTNLQAAIGVAQLERIDGIILARQRVEDLYRKTMADIEFIEFQNDDLPDRKKVTWLVSLLINQNNRDELITKLKEKRFDVRCFFISLSQMDIYKDFVFSNKNSKYISERGISLPSSINISEEIIMNIAEIIRKN